MKIRLFFSALALCLLFLGGIYYLNLNRFTSQTESAEKTHHVIQGLEKIYTDFREIQANYADYLLTQDPAYVRSCRRAMEEVPEFLRGARRLMGENLLLQRDNEELGRRITAETQRVERGLMVCKSGHFEDAIADLRKTNDKKDAQEVRALVRQMAGLESWLLKSQSTLEATNRRKNSHIVLFSVLFAILVCGLTAALITRQIRERQATIDLLRASEERLRFLSEMTADAFLTLDDKGTVIGLNTVATGMFGHDGVDLVGRPFSVLLPDDPQGAPIVFEDFLALTLRTGLNSVEASARKKDGTLFPVEFSVSDWSSKGRDFYSVIVRDITDRRFFLKTLLNNEHRLFQFLDSLPIGIWAHDEHGAPYYANQAAKEIFGMDFLKDKVEIGQIPGAFHLFIQGTDVPYPISRHPLSAAISGKKGFADDIEVHTPRGSTPLHVWGSPVFDERGEVKYALTAAIDVTEQKRTTESLRESEVKFRRIFEDSPLGMIFMEGDGTLTEANKAFCDMLEYNREDLVGKNVLSITHPEDLAVSQSILWMGTTDPRQRVEKRYVTRSGKTLWAAVRPISMAPEGGETGPVLSLVENITERREAQAALQDSEDQFRLLLESTGEGIYGVDVNGRCTFCNPSTLHLLGYRDKGELLGMDMHRLIHYNRSDGLPYPVGDCPVYETYAKGLSSFRDDEVFWRADGTSFPVEYRSYPVYRSGLVTGAVITFTDISERKQVDEMKRDLISVVSHQLKTPVAEINGYIENMLDGLAGALTERQKEYLQDMRDIGRENFRMISDLLNISKIERGVLSVVAKPVPLREIIDLAVRDYEATIQKKGLRLRVEPAPGEAMVMADRDKTIETLRNIINNAIKFTDQGGITIRTRVENGSMIVEVADTGVGMSSDVLSHLFSRRRMMGSEAGRSGAGLGLFIAKNFMKLQNGDIQAESVKGKGTKFFVRIPIAYENTDLTF